MDRLGLTLHPTAVPSAHSSSAAANDPRLLGVILLRGGMVYDPTLHHIVLFGGQNSGQLLGDTWEF